jgi:hypothetical protein
MEVDVKTTNLPAYQLYSVENLGSSEGIAMQSTSPANKSGSIPLAEQSSDVAEAGDR